jgi:hypothetical protein
MTFRVWVVVALSLGLTQMGCGSKNGGSSRTGGGAGGSPDAAGMDTVQSLCPQNPVCASITFSGTTLPTSIDDSTWDACGQCE